MAGRAEHDDGQDPGAFVLPQPAQHIKAGYLRQVDVKQDESRQAVAGAGAVTAQEVIDSSGTVTYDHDFVIYVIEPQCTKGQVDIVLVVLDQERSEEHTSELQSRGHLVCRLLLEKKKKNNHKCRIYILRSDL